MPSDPAAYSIRSVERAIDLLSALEAAPHPVGLSDLGRACNMPRATVLRLLGVLAKRGLVDKVQGRYQLGVGTVPLAHSFLIGNNLSRAALPVMQELAAATEETVSLFVRLGFSRVVVQRVEGLRPLRYAVPIGQRLPLHLGIGKVLAAAMPNDELQQLLDELGPMKLVTGEPLAREALLVDLDRVRQRGYSISINERSMGVVSVAAPVLGSDGGTIAAIAVIGPVDRIPQEKIEPLTVEVRHAAQAISERYRSL